MKIEKVERQKRQTAQRDQQFGTAPSYVSDVSFRNIPLCPITRAAFGACARASSNAVFHSNKSSEVSACIKQKLILIRNKKAYHSFFITVT
jgi:hypothetical protein